MSVIQPPNPQDPSNPAPQAPQQNPGIPGSPPGAKYVEKAEDAHPADQDGKNPDGSPKAPVVTTTETVKVSPSQAPKSPQRGNG
jgi:hypothetical protein